MPLPPGPAIKTSADLTAIQLLLKYLEAEGVKYIFGIPGGPLMPLYEAIFDDGQKIKPIITKHEEGAAFMADGYARVSGQLGVCCTTTGPGATNALTGIACAYRDSVPILVLTAQIGISAFGKGAAQESSPQGIDIVNLYKTVTKGSYMLPAPEKTAEIIRFLLRTSLSSRPGPIHLNFPADMFKRLVRSDLIPPSSYRPCAESFDRRSIKEASQLLLRAHNPVILAGYGVHLARAYKELLNFAYRLKIPVATTPKGKSVFPENHILSLGVFGLAGSPQADDFIFSSETDVVFAIGTSLGEASTHAWDPRLVQGKKFLQMDIDPKEIGKNYPVDVGLVGDARHVLLELNYQIERDLKEVGLPELTLGRRLAKIRAIKAMRNRVVDMESMDSESVPLKPQRVIAELRRAMSDSAILFVDIGNVMAWAIHYFTTQMPGSFFINMGFGSMGHGLAAAIGGKLAAPHRPVISLVGDGAFAMNGMEIHTAVENKIPVVWVVMNNGGHGMVHMGETIQFKGKFNTALFNHPLQIAKIAEAMGARAIRVHEPGEVEQAVRYAIQANEPYVVEVMIDQESRPPSALRLETLEKFFNPAAEKKKSEEKLEYAEPSKYADDPVIGKMV